jgi:hypothetical protein
MGHGEYAIKKSVAVVLKEVLPNAAFDLERLAAEIIDRAEIDAVEIIEAREEGMQKALTATMDYLSGCMKNQRQRIDHLEAEVTRLNLELAKRGELNG